MTVRVTTPFTARSTAAEVIEGTDLTGRRAIVTGAASGLGIETARVLAAAGAEVTLAVRDLAAGERIARNITAGTGNKQVHVAPLDLADQASVAEFTAAWDGPLHILVNNAGVMAAPETRTAQGWELHFATNHLGRRGAGGRADDEPPAHSLDRLPGSGDGEAARGAPGTRLATARVVVLQRGPAGSTGGGAPVIVTPPSAVRTVPVTSEESSLAGNTGHGRWPSQCHQLRQ